MKKYSIFIFFYLSLLCLSNPLWAQKEKPTRILFLVDASSSMLDPWVKNENRFAAAQNLVGAIIDSIVLQNENVEFGLRVYGNRYPASRQVCYDTRMEIPFQKSNSEWVKGRLALTYPQGISPIAYSLEKAALDDITDPNYAYSLILITDGGESCNGSICEVMERIMNYKINFQPYIVSLYDYAPLRKEYECMGKYMLLTKEEDFQPVISTIMKENNYFIANEETIYNPELFKPSKPIQIDTVTTPIKTPQPKDTIVKESTPKIIQAEDNQTDPKHSKEISKINYAAFPKPRVKYTKGESSYPQLLALQKLPVFKFEETPEAPAIKPIQRIKTILPKEHWRMTSLYTIPIADKIRIKKLPTIKVPEELLTVQKPPEKQEIKEAPKVNQTASEKPEDPGTVQVYFTNGKGKYYVSSPPIIIRNINNNKEVYNGLRTTDMKGNPESMSFPDGKYEVISTKSGRKAQFEIRKGTQTKVEIVVGYGSLSFRYLGTNEVPQGYVATVSQTFNKHFKAVEQPTETVLTYDAENYHIEINTLPPMMLNLDIEFDNNYTADIPKEGIIQIMNENELGRADFLYLSNGSFFRFYEMNIYGDTENQIVKILPGKYQIRYVIKDPQSGSLRNRVKEFEIHSKQTLSFTLD